MSKRLQKLHARKVARAKQRVQISEPDVRTPEQIKAAREKSRPVAAGPIAAAGGRVQPTRNNRATSIGGAAKTDA